ncbi:MAG: peptidoglycan editing factor PgeF [Bacteroidaceae bacterium]|nr:peptidoglycan editing factor PgeF [Bacteroidaceae bacterium]
MENCTYKYSLREGATAFSTTRHGGVSVGAYASFNANHYCGDDPKNVEANRSILCRELGISNDHLIVPHQTHDTRTLIIDDDFFALSPSVRAERLEGIDAVCTNLPDTCVCVSTADCIPILIYDEAHKVVSAIHAGWRGTVKRIVEQNIKVMSDNYGTNPSDCHAVIGPGISLAAFEVGDEVYDEFHTEGFDMNLIAKRYPASNNNNPSTTSTDKESSKWHIDLPLCNKLQLFHAGLREDHITLSGICTYTQHSDFFSARRLGIKSGRILNGIMLQKK